MYCICNIQRWCYCYAFYSLKWSFALDPLSIIITFKTTICQFDTFTVIWKWKTSLSATMAKHVHRWHVKCKQFGESRICLYHEYVPNDNIVHHLIYDKTQSSNVNGKFIANNLNSSAICQRVYFGNVSIPSRVII